MELKHTCGEWIYSDWIKVRGQGEVPTKIVGSGIEHGRLIAELNFSNADPELSSEKVLANAKLIAAAPDILIALKNLVDYFKWNIGDPTFHAYVDGVVAIKKATE